ncbi:hypothetical protein AGMMS49579_26380 [Spirochaetia bacterium]|nr:hypothetical protein AGMMS49579_26380 [Spirochaetia bacterium]
MEQLLANYSALVEEAARACSYPYSYLSPNRQDIPAWQKAGRNKLVGLLSYNPPSCEMNPRILSRLSYEGLSVEIIAYNEPFGPPTEGFFLKPLNHTGKLPGMGGVFNTVNAHLYHYAGNNPIKYTDPDGRHDEVVITIAYLHIPFVGVIGNYNALDAEGNKSGGSFFVKGIEDVFTSNSTHEPTTGLSGVITTYDTELGDAIRGDINPRHSSRTLGGNLTKQGEQSPGTI